MLENKQAKTGYEVGSQMRPELLTVGEAATVLKITPAGVRWLIDTGRLKAVRTAKGMRLVRSGDLHRFSRQKLANSKNRTEKIRVHGISSPEIAGLK